MSADAGSTLGVRALRLLLLLAALDSLAAGSWAVLRPADLFAWLQVRPTHDGLLLCRALGALMLCHVPCLALAALRPRSWGALVLVPLLGRSLLSCVWLWLLNSDRVRPAPENLRLLLIHAAAWLPVFLTFLFLNARMRKLP